MQIIPLYRYIRPDGGVTTSLVKPDTDYTEMARLIADEGYILTNGTSRTYCTDTDNSSAWSEIIDTKNEGELTETEEKALAYDILMGVTK